MKRPKVKEPTPAPEPVAAPKVEAVTVAPSIAATGSEDFNTGKGLFEKGAEKPGEDGSESNDAMSPHLLTYPFIAIFELAAQIRQWDGWKLDADERVYFDKLSAYLLKRFSKVKDLDLIIAVTGIMALMVKKGAGDIEYHKLHPMVEARLPAAGATNPSSPTGRKGPRK